MHAWTDSVNDFVFFEKNYCVCYGIVRVFSYLCRTIPTCAGAFKPIREHYYIIIKLNSYEETFT